MDCAEPVAAVARSAAAANVIVIVVRFIFFPPSGPLWRSRFTRTISAVVVPHLEACAERGILLKIRAGARPMRTGMNTSVHRAEPSRYGRLYGRDVYSRIRGTLTFT